MGAFADREFVGHAASERARQFRAASQNAPQLQTTEKGKDEIEGKREELLDRAGKTWLDQRHDNLHGSVITTSSKAAEGRKIPEGSLFGFANIALQDNSDVPSWEDARIELSIAVRPNIEVDVSKVVIRIYFFETSGADPRPKLTSSKTNYQWMTDRLAQRWVEANPEILIASVSRPAGASIDRGTLPAPTGNFYGYVARIYYDGALQDEEGAPRVLLKMFPSRPK